MYKIVVALAEVVISEVTQHISKWVSAEIIYITSHNLIIKNCKNTHDHRWYRYVERLGKFHLWNCMHFALMAKAVWHCTRNRMWYMQNVSRKT